MASIWANISPKDWELILDLLSCCDSSYVKSFVVFCNPHATSSSSIVRSDRGKTVMADLDNAITDALLQKSAQSHCVQGRQAHIELIR